MNSISRLDRLVAQLRVQLKRSAGARSQQRPPQDDAQSASPISALVTLKAAGTSDEVVLARCLIEALLREELGDGLVNSAEFHQMSESLVGVLADDPEAWAWCRECIELA